MSALSLNVHQTDWLAAMGRLATHRWTPTLVTLIAIILLSHVLALWSWRLVKAPSPVNAPTARSVMPSTPDSATTLRDLLAANLFGVVAPGSAGFSPDSLPLTSLNLVLTGVMVRGQGSYALIRIEGGDETSVSIGEEITAGARLHAVYPDRVILSRGGGYELLMLKDAIPDLPSGSIIGGPARSAAPTESIVRAQGNNFTVNREGLQEQMQRPEFLSQALIVPNTGGGFLVREVQPGSLYEKLGVRVGDVIRSVNGKPINNIEDVMKLYQGMGGLQQASNVSIEVVRGGRAQQLQYRFE